METLVLVVHVLIAIVMVALVLLQQGKGAEMGASFGSGASGTVFGSAGSAGFLTKLTAFLALAFFVTSLGLAVFAKNKSAAPAEFGTIPAPVKTQGLPVFPNAAPSAALGSAPKSTAAPAVGDLPVAPATK